MDEEKIVEFLLEFLLTSLEDGAIPIEVAKIRARELQDMLNDGFRQEVKDD